MGRGWRKVVEIGEGPFEAGGLAATVLAWFLGCVLVYAALFATGFILYGQGVAATAAVAISAAAGVGLWRLLPRLGWSE